MIIDCLSDLHGNYPKLDGGDMLIIAGDFTRRDTLMEHSDMLEWINRQEYDKKVIIAGNHDNFLESNPKFYAKTNIDYLCDSGTEFKKLKIWGSPWTAQFDGINPHCCAFTNYYGCDTDDWLTEKWTMIPDDTDILITHCPPFTIFDKTTRGEQVGSPGLMAQLIKRVKPKLHVFGHIHEAYGHEKYWDMTHFVNASHVNERYEPVNDPIRIIL